MSPIIVHLPQLLRVKPYCKLIVLALAGTALAATPRGVQIAEQTYQGVPAESIDTEVHVYEVSTPQNLAMVEQQERSHVHLQPIQDVHQAITRMNELANQAGGSTPQPEDHVDIQVEVGPEGNLRNYQRRATNLHTRARQSVAINRQPDGAHRVNVRSDNYVGYKMESALAGMVGGVVSAAYLAKGSDQIKETIIGAGVGGGVIGGMLGYPMGAAHCSRKATYWSSFWAGLLITGLVVSKWNQKNPLTHPVPPLTISGTPSPVAPPSVAPASGFGIENKTTVTATWKKLL